MNPGDWINTGWGARHRVRAADDQWVTLVCHSADPTNRAARDRINFDADDTLTCDRCRLTPGLGPMPGPTFGEVRRDPSTGAAAVCEHTWDGRTPTSPADRVWRVNHTADVGPQLGVYLDSYTVAVWEKQP